MPSRRGPSLARDRDALRRTRRAHRGQRHPVRNFTVERRTWTHVVVTWSEQNARGRVYRDGTLLEEHEYPQPFAPDGQRFQLGRGFVGMIDEVRLYARELTPSEVAAVP